MANRSPRPSPADHRETCRVCGSLIIPERASIATGALVGSPANLALSAMRGAQEADGGPAGQAASTKRTVRLGSSAAQDMAGETPKGNPKLAKAKPKPDPEPAIAERDDRTELIHVATDGTVTVREGDDGGPRTLEGIAVPYGRPTRPGATREYGSRRESFRAGAFRRVLAERGERPWPVLDSHTGTVVGGVTFRDTPEGLAYSGTFLRSQAAADAAERAEAGLVAPSIEFAPGAYAERGDLVDHTDVAILAGFAFTHRPAYSGTTVTIREDHTVELCEVCNLPVAEGDHSHTQPVQAPNGAVAQRLDLSPTQLRALVTEAADEAVRRNMEGRNVLADRGGVPERFAQYPSLGHIIHAAAQDDADLELRSYAARALADVTYTSGANAGMTTANTFGQVRRLVDLARPTITAFGGPAELLGVGGTFGFPYFDGTLTDLVGAQSAQKADITSAAVDIKRATATIATYAGGADVSFQLIRRSDPGYLEAWGRIMLVAWGYVTNLAFVTALEAGSVTGDFAEALSGVDATELKNLMVDASVAVQLATGIPAEFVIAGTNAFKAAAKLMTPAPVFNAAGTSNARTLEVNIAGLPVIHDPAVTTAKYLVSNTQAARWHEEGPFQAVATDVLKLGQDVAYWSLGAPAIYVPAGVIEVYDVTP